MWPHLHLLLGLVHCRVPLQAAIAMPHISSVFSKHAW